VGVATRSPETDKSDPPVRGECLYTPNTDSIIFWTVCLCEVGVTR